MYAKIWTALTYLVVGMVAFWLTSSSVQIERYSGRWEAGFPFIYVRDQTGSSPTTGQGLNLQFQRNQVTLRTPDGELTGTYEWLAPDLIALHFASYTMVGTVAPLPCTEVPTLFQADCQQRIMHGYPAPIAATSVSQTSISSYPAPIPSTGTTDALYQGIDGVYQVVVTRPQLTLTARTGAVQVFTATP